MPLYDFRCGEGHETEARKEMACSEIVCPSCGGVARRKAVYAEQTIMGETVARQRLGNSIKSKHGYFRFDHADEALRELAHDADREGRDPPDLWKHTKEKVGKSLLKTAQ